VIYFTHAPRPHAAQSLPYLEVKVGSTSSYAPKIPLFLYLAQWLIIREVWATAQPVMCGISRKWCCLTICVSRKWQLPSFFWSPGIKLPRLRLRCTPNVPILRHTAWYTRWFYLHHHHHRWLESARERQHSHRVSVHEFPALTCLWSECQTPHSARFQSPVSHPTQLWIVRYKTVRPCSYPDTLGLADWKRCATELGVWGRALSGVQGQSWSGGLGGEAPIA